MIEKNIRFKKIRTEECIQSYYVIDLKKENSSSMQSWYYDFLKSIQDDEYIIFEKVFGCLEYQYIIDKIHKEYMLHNKKPMHPTIFIEGKSIRYSIFSGAVIHTIKYNEISKVRYINDVDIPYATEYCINNARKLYLTNSFQKGSDEFCSDIRMSLKKLKACMDSADLQYDSIARTWFYLNKINLNYKDFNTMRRDFFNEIEIDYSENSDQLPASTCIGGNSNNTNCVMEFYCCENNSIVKRKRVFNKDQNEAEGNNYLYQPTFSRAISISHKDYVELQISGTASINSQGQTVYVNDPYNQIKRTLLNIKNLLDAFDMDFCDIVFSTCFFKKSSYCSLINKVLNELKIKEFLSIYVVGDICREDLLFEMDAIAIK